MRLAAIALVCLSGLACKRATPGYCGGDGGEAKCAVGMVCNPNTLLCEADDGGVEHPSDAGDAGDASDDGGVEHPSDASDASPGCRSDDDCTTADGGPPACIVDGGLCVECLADKHCPDKNKHLCLAQQCTPCTSDAQCPAVTNNKGLCINDGHCATVSELIYVQNMTGCAATGGGTAATPFCTAAQGVGALSADRSIIIMLGELEPWSIMGQPAGTTLVTVIGRSASISAGDQNGIVVGGAKVVIRNLRVTNGTKAGILATNQATLILDSCVIDKLDQGGIVINGSDYRITNTVLTNNGSVLSSTSGDTLYSAVMIRNSFDRPSTIFSHNTVVSNLSGISCDAAYPVDASIVAKNTVGNGSTCLITPCCANVDPLLMSDYHLTGNSPCIDQIDDVTTVGYDIDGHPRPNGARSDCGADEYYAP